MNEAVNDLLSEQFIHDADKLVKGDTRWDYIMLEKTFISSVDKLLEAQRKACWREANKNLYKFAEVKNNIFNAQITEEDLC